MESYLARPKERPRRKMTTLSYSLVVFRVKKRETGKVKTTTRKESSSRMRERPFEDGDDSNVDQDSKDCSDDDDTEERKDDRPASAGSGSGGLFAILPDPQTLPDPQILPDPQTLRILANPHQNLPSGPTSNSGP